MMIQILELLSFTWGTQMNSWLLASTWSSHGCCGMWVVNQEMVLFFPPSFCHSSFQGDENKLRGRKKRENLESSKRKANHHVLENIYRNISRNLVRPKEWLDKFRVLKEKQNKTTTTTTTNLLPRNTITLDPVLLKGRRNKHLPRWVNAEEVHHHETCLKGTSKGSPWN